MSFARNIRPFVDDELTAAMLAEKAGSPAEAFAHLERAHILGQASTLHHVRVHVAMLLWAIHQRAVRELIGQLTRIVGAATKTMLGWVPTGNTGGANVSPFQRMAVPPDLARVIAAARKP